MNFSSLGEISIGIFPHMDQDKIIYCLQSAIRRSQIQKCTNITGMLPYEHALIFYFQVDKELFENDELFKGLKMRPVRLSETVYGTKLEHGNYSGVSGLLYTGVIDTFSTYELSGVDDDFAHTTPFGSDGFGLLMQRPINGFLDFNFSRVLASIDLSVYGLLFVFFLVLTAIAYVNEKKHTVFERNSLWQILNPLLIGGNGLKHEN
jgi:hypothetical protein